MFPILKALALSMLVNGVPAHLVERKATQEWTPVQELQFEEGEIPLGPDLQPLIIFPDDFVEPDDDLPILDNEA